MKCARLAIAGIFLLFQQAVVEAQIQAIQSKTRAVVIGISKYENIPSLRFAHKDAEAFADYLRSASGGNVPEENIMLLTNEKATQGNIGAAFTWLMTESQADDQAIIFFSGHGDVETQMTNLGYLLAYNANKTTYMAGGAIPIYTLQAIITNLSVGKQVQVLVITDACHSGNLAGAETGAKTTALAMSTQFANEVKIMSCRPDEVSLEDERWGGGHSVFSYYLLDGLRGLADQDEDRRVTLDEIDRFMKDSVRRATVAYRKQTPVTFGNPDRVVAKVDQKSAEALRQRNKPAHESHTGDIASKNGIIISDTAAMRLYQAFEDALRKGQLLSPEKDAAFAIYQQIKDHPALKSQRNLMRNDLAAALQDEAQKAINDYLSADPREMRRRWGRDDSRYRLYPDYLQKAAELLGESHFSYNQIKAREYYFSGLNLRLQGERTGVAAEKDSLFRAAKQLQDKTLQLDSTAAYAYNELGLLARRFSDYSGSIQYFNRAVRFSPTWVLPWANLCGSYNELTQTESAEKCGLKAIALDSTYALAQYNLGYVYLTKQDLPKAAIHFQKTIEHSPEYANAYYNLGLACFKTGQFEDAEKMWLEYKTRVPDDPDVYQNLGELYLKTGKRNEAEANFQKAISLNPQYGRAFLSMSELYLIENNYEKSDKWFGDYSMMEPKSAEGFFHLAKRNSKNADQALNYLESALKGGYKDFDVISKEPRLETLRNTSKYKALMKMYFPEKG